MSTQDLLGRKRTLLKGAVCIFALQTTQIKEQLFKSVKSILKGDFSDHKRVDLLMEKYVNKGIKKIHNR